MNLKKIAISVFFALGLGATCQAQGLIGRVITDTETNLSVEWIWDQVTPATLTFSALAYWDVSLAALPPIVPLAPLVVVSATHLGGPHDVDGTADSFSHLSRVGDPVYLGGVDHPVTDSSPAHFDSYTMRIGPMAAGPVLITLSGSHTVPIPEPATSVLMLAGLAALAEKARRRNRRDADPS
jgi:hypothetical protein